MTDDYLQDIPVRLSPIEFDGDRKILFPAFIKAQAAMTTVTKGRTNDAFKSKYAELADVIDAILPALNANGFGLMQPPCFGGGDVDVETILVHESGGLIRSTLTLKPSKTDPQGVGSAITYARKYALMALAGVAPEDDDGNAASGPREQQRDTRPPQRTKGEASTPTAAHLAAKTDIKMCKSQDQCDLWKEANAQALADFDPVEHDELAVFWKAHRRTLPPTLPPTTQAEPSPFEEAA